MSPGLVLFRMNYHDELFLFPDVHHLSVCVTYPQAPLTCSFGECSLSQYFCRVFSPLFFVKPCTCMIFCLRTLKNGLKALAARGPSISTMSKPMGIFIFWVWQKRRIWLWDGAQMNRPVLDPQKNTEGQRSDVWLVDYLSDQQLPAGPHSNRWHSLVQGWNMGVGGHLYCCCCTFNTKKPKNTKHQKIDCRVHLFLWFLPSLSDNAVYSLCWLKGCEKFVDSVSHAPSNKRLWINSK